MRKCGAVVVTKTEKIQFRQGTPDVRWCAVLRPSDVRWRADVRCLGKNRARDEWRDFGDEKDGEVEIERIGGWKREVMVGKARSTRSNANPWTKSNKISTHQQITKKIGAIFGGAFLDLGRKQQNQARKHGVGAPKT